MLVVLLASYEFDGANGVGNMMSWEEILPASSQGYLKTVKIFSVHFRPKAITIKEWNTADSIKLDEIVGTLQLEMTPIVPKRKKL